MLEEHGFYEILRASGVFPDHATQRISAKNASTVEANFLNEPRGTALLTMERTTYDAAARRLNSPNTSIERRATLWSLR